MKLISNKKKIIYFGKEYEPNRKMAAYTDEGIKYFYSGKTVEALQYTDLIKELKDKIEEVLNKKFNSILSEWR